MEDTRIHTINPHVLYPHPYNDRIYGRDESIDALKERIAVSGWIKPLVVTQNNIIISGHRRWRVALALNLDAVPVERRAFASETDELEALLLENHAREKTVEQKVREGETWKQIETERARQASLANLQQGQRKPEVENFPPRDTGKTRDKVAAKVGFGSGRNYGKAAKVVATADKLKEQGNVQESHALLKVLNEQSVDAAAKVLQLPEHQQVAVLETLATGKAKDVIQAKTLVKREKLREQAKLVTLPETVQLLHGDFVEVGCQIADNSVDLIFTDPPYHEEHLGLWSDLGIFAARVLKPGGVVLAYSGQAFLPRVLNVLGEHLDYCWTLARVQPGSHVSIHKYALWTCWKPLVLFSKGKMREHEWFVDAYTGFKGEKDNHEWAQGEDETDYFVNKLTRPGELVVDPMCGSGPIVRMALRCKRRAIGIELDRQRYDVALGMMA